MEMQGSGGTVALVLVDEVGDSRTEGTAAEKAEFDGEDDGGDDDEEDQENEAGAEEDYERGAPAFLLLLLPGLRLLARLPVAA